MNNIEIEKIRSDVIEIANRVKKFGRNSEAVKIDMNLVITGQPAINYKVMRLFCPDLAEQELVNLTFKLGVKNGAELIKILALKNGIRV